MVTFCSLLCLMIFLMLHSTWCGNVKMHIVSTEHSPTTLDYAVRSVIYSEFPNLLFVTTRNSGLSVFNLEVPKKPVMIARWTESMTIEGQDLKNGLLCIVDIGKTPGLWSIEIKRLQSGDIEMKTLNFMKMPTGICALHVTLFERGNENFAVVSNHGLVWEGGNINEWVSPQWPVLQTGIVLVNLTTPSQPYPISIIPLKVGGPEGLTVISGSNNSLYVLVGGYLNDIAEIVDISLVTDPKVVKTWSKPYYNLFCSLTRKSEPDLVYATLWEDPGGLIVFNVSNMPEIEEVSHIATKNLSSTNRVNMHPSLPLIFMPLEYSAGVGVVDISIVTQLRQVGLFWMPHEARSVYCLGINPCGSHIYVFGAYSKSMYVVELEFI